jgi:hypothetical protein
MSQTPYSAVSEAATQSAYQAAFTSAYDTANLAAYYAASQRAKLAVAGALTHAATLTASNAASQIASQSASDSACFRSRFRATDTATTRRSEFTTKTPGNQVHHNDTTAQCWSLEPPGHQDTKKPSVFICGFFRLCSSVVPFGWPIQCLRLLASHCSLIPPLTSSALGLC